MVHNETTTIEESHNEKQIRELSEESEESSTDIENEDEELEPPKLKYTRLNKLPTNFFNKDPISTSFFHDDIFIFATHSGIIHICKCNFESIRTFKAHKASILSVYTNGIYFASGSMDGTVVIGSILDDKDIVAYDFQRPIHAVILDPNYAKNRSFISGGMAGKVIYSSKSWLGKRSDIVLDEGNGPIVKLELVKDDLIFWMNDKGINVFQISSKTIIAVIEKPEDSARSDLYWPRCALLDSDRLIIAWSNYVWSLRVSVKSKEDNESIGSSGMSRILPSTASISFRSNVVQEKKIEVEHVFKMDDLIAGIASFNDDLWMCLTYNPPTQDEEIGKKEFYNPDLKLINSMTGEVEFEEEIGLKNINNLGLNDFNLLCHIETIPKYFIISAKDCVIAQELQIEDRLDWYLNKENYLQVYEISQYLVTPYKRLSFGIQYVDSLVKEDDWDKAGQFLKKLLEIEPVNEDQSMISEEISSININDEIVSQWDTWSNIFINSGHIKELTDVIPETELIKKEIYDKILLYWIENDGEKLLQLVKDWDISIYEVSKIQKELESKSGEIDENLERALIVIFNKSLQFTKAIPHLKHLKDPNIVEYLSEHHILPKFINDLPEFISLRFENAKDLTTLPVPQIEDKVSDIIDILINYRMEISPKTIVSIFNKANLSILNFFYLENLSSIDEILIKGFGDERMKLYSEFKRSSLLPYLKNNNDYDIDYAISICESNEYIEELVYTYGKINENKKAIELVINKLNDPIMAINFAKHQNDKETWEILIENSITRSNFIKALIENSDESSNLYYDPITILQRMPQDIKIEGLNLSIIEFSKNNELNKLINQLILNIIYKNLKENSVDYTNYKTKGLEIEIDKELKELKKLIQKFETILILKKNEDIELKLESKFLDDNVHHLAYENLYEKLIHIKELESRI
ncbi:unnamed protein product [Candida verbasci]|uniref:Vacuolar protein sorting-associated protein 41 n=1 Tax=Candida verbasci TaxID=1227364 RepID=A0A9W4TVM2_9ASCO|nr:unnamed protein product [Candida verbasci]